jgi:hypothetical protein
MKITTDELAKFLSADWGKVTGVGERGDWYLEGDWEF